MLRIDRAAAFGLILALIVPLAASGPALAQMLSNGRLNRGAIDGLTLPDGRYAMIYPNGQALIYPNAKERDQFEVRSFPPAPRTIGNETSLGLPDRYKLMAALMKRPSIHPYVQGWVVVVYRPGTEASKDNFDLDRQTLIALRRAIARHQPLTAPEYTNDFRLNRELAQLGVDRSDRLFTQFNRSVLSSMSSSVRPQNGQPILDFANTYKLHLASASVPHAVQALSKLMEIAYVSPDWTVDTMHTDAVPFSQTAKADALRRAQSMSERAFGSRSLLAQEFVPTNYGVTSSLQSMLNAPSDDVIGAYDEIERHFHQLPGEGEIITNVSLGDLDDAGAANNNNDPCSSWVSSYGPTTELLGRQRYLNMPSMPLIPTYTADDSGNLDGAGEVCGIDPVLSEVDLDFAMMAPLPHDRQRAGEMGSGITDLFGIAPGAQYRLIVPADFAPTFTDIQAAMLAAALQTPRPNVITASIGYGLDSYGFPGRYLEDDPLTESIVASIVQSYHVVVCIAANDGMRSDATFAAVGPSGGSAPTDLAAPGQAPTNIDDVQFSTTPSLDFDSGAIAAGGTTLDDIFANPPQYAVSARVRAQHAYADTRWTGFTSFSSGYGNRIDLSAPADNVVAFEHYPGGADDAVQVVVNGGTSASSPEIAATAAVVQQVARLTGHPFRDPLDLRAFLKQTAAPVPPVTQADSKLNVGPQIDLRRAVETLLERTGVHDTPSVPRVAIEQRRDVFYLDGLFQGDTDPADIDLSHSGNALYGSATNEHAWITVAPDWEFAPAGAKYSLRVAGTAKVLATTPWARLQPETILEAAGYALASPSTRSVKLAYNEIAAGRSLSTTFSLTFGPAPERSDLVMAPQVPPVVTKGDTIPVTYDFSHADHVNGPLLQVSLPGRLNPETGLYYNPVYSLPLTESKGTVQVPLSKLPGGGIYSFTVLLNPGGGGPAQINSDFATTRVALQSSDARPAAPLLSYQASMPGHLLEIPYDGTFKLSYDVSNVAGATGAALEISAAGPTLGNTSIYNPFNNPNGSERDHDGIDTGSIYYAPLGGTSGTVMLDAKTIGLYSAMYHVVRVIPMKGGVAAGEAGDVSAITMDGVVPADGGTIGYGYGVNGNGNDGFLTEYEPTAPDQYLSALETFDQKTNLITQTVESELTGPSETYITPPFVAGGGPGIFGNDVGLMATVDLLGSGSAAPIAYNLLDPSGTIGASWTPPIPGSFLTLDAIAANQANDNVAFLERLGTSTYNVFGSRLLQNTSTPLYSITAPIASQYATGEVTGFAQDTSTNTAVAVASDYSCSAPTIVMEDLTNGGAPTSFVGGQTGSNWTAAVDSTTGKAIVPTWLECGENGVGIFNLAAKSSFEVVPPTYGPPFHLYVSSAADPIHHLFLIADINGPQGAGYPPIDNNRLSAIYVYDESGTLKETIQQVALLGSFNATGALMEINPKERTGYIKGPGFSELAVFKY
ncbi:MAG TPA: S8 family serine peptidase [Candidatus Acidoferrales bacterium]|nr:S8 family serine peptidase [Candidatus Acidoferrales bacterium]